MLFTTQTETSSAGIFSSENLLYTFLILVFFWIIWYGFKKNRALLSRRSQWILSAIFLLTGIFTFIISIGLDSVHLSLGAIMLCALGMYMAPLKIFNLPDAEGESEEASFSPKKQKIIEENIEYEENLYQQMDREGHDYYELKNYKKSINCFVKMLQLDPNSAEAWYMLGKINLDRNRIKEARISFINAYKIDKEDEKVVTALREVNALVRPPQEKSDG